MLVVKISIVFDSGEDIMRPFQVLFLVTNILWDESSINKYISVCFSTWLVNAQDDMAGLRPCLRLTFHPNKRDVHTLIENSVFSGINSVSRKINGWIIDQHDDDCTKTRLLKYYINYRKWLLLLCFAFSINWSFRINVTIHPVKQLYNIWFLTKKVIPQEVQKMINTAITFFRKTLM